MFTISRFRSLSKITVPFCAFCIVFIPLNFTASFAGGSQETAKKDSENAAVDRQTVVDEVVDRPAVPVIPDEPRSIDPSELLPEKLTISATVDFRTASLAELVDWLTKEHGLTVLVQQTELDKEGVMLGDPIAYWLDDSPIHLLLDRLSLMDVGWFYDDDVIYITSKKVADQRQVTTPYHLGELLDDGHSSTQLIEIIESTINPDDWDENGGQGRINLVGDMIFVRNTNAVHRKIRALLLALQKHGRQTFLDMPLADVELRERLTTTVSVNFRDTPLEDAIAELARQTQSDLRLDRSALRTTRIRERQPVTLQINDRPLAIVLDFMLGELGLSWKIQHGVLWITRTSSKESVFETALYDVRDLCADSDEADGLSYAVQSQMPEVWADEGGNADLRFGKPGTMVVWANADTHSQLLDLLEKYRIALRNSKVRQVSEEEDKEETVYYRLHANVADDLYVNLRTLIEPDSWQTGERPDAMGTIRKLESRPEAISEKFSGVAVESTIARKVLVIHQRRSVHEKIREIIYRIENGDSVPVPGFGMGGMGGMGGGFGGGMFSVPNRSSTEK